jgi:UDP-N-acetylglucosamine:LPS N-acetylglucosamine transferase
LPGKRSRRHDRTTRVLIVSGSVGAGHDGAAAELRRQLTDAGVAAQVQDFLDALPYLARALVRRGYVVSIHYRPGFFEWLFTSAENALWMRRVIDVMCWVARRRIRRWSRGAALVVSTFPFASQTLGQLKQRGTLATPVITYLTDPAAHRLWVHPAVDHHLTVTHATALTGSRQYGVPMQAVGGLVAAAFARTRTPAEREAIRESLDIPASAPLVLISCGSEGMGDVRTTVQALAGVEKLHTVVLCGRNKQLRLDLQGLPRVSALGWRGDVPDLMAAADVLVHNAGGLSLTEALTAGLPAVTFRPIPGHGQVNAQVLAAAGIAPWPRDDAALVAEVIRQYSAGRRDTLALQCGGASRFVLSLLRASPAQRPPTRPVRFRVRPLRTTQQNDGQHRGHSGGTVESVGH